MSIYENPIILFLLFIAIKLMKIGNIGKNLINLSKRVLNIPTEDINSIISSMKDSFPVGIKGFLSKNDG